MKPMSILLTDDESRIRLMFRTALESEGYSIDEAADGVEALDAIQHRRPDLVVLDLNMPKMDGLAVLEAMNRITGDKPRVIILTAFGSIDAAVKATRLGAADFLEKPVTPTALRRAVRNVLAEPELDAPPAGIDVDLHCEGMLRRVRRLLRSDDLTAAELLLKKTADQTARTSADYFNLLGVFYEGQRKWRLARRYYGKAMRADKKYDPAQRNMRRVYELYTFGRSDQPVLLGDESDEPSRLPLQPASN